MARAKYRQLFEEMKQENALLFEKFGKIHDAYQQNREKNQDKFHQVGKKVVAIIRDWERRLCSGMGRTRYGHYSAGVAEKFWDLARKEFKLIDMVGVKIEKVAVTED
ncbi:MAG: hypothetical protein U9O78_01000 [Patescibacteria group bacterium]|nr:hypothetical protein [Patescibacteria group bacterium]